MNYEQRFRRGLFDAIFVLTCLSSAAVPTFAQDTAKPAIEKWRPKDGLYADPGADLSDRCLDHTEFFIELADKSIGGNEWSCEITKLTDTAPGAIRLDMLCYDYNLALSINSRDPNAYERKFKEIMLLKKRSEAAVFVRQTQNGKFKDPGGEISYCPEEAQRAHAEARARDRAAAEQKAAEERSRRKP